MASRSLSEHSNLTPRLLQKSLDRPSIDFRRLYSDDKILGRIPDSGLRAVAEYLERVIEVEKGYQKFRKQLRKLRNYGEEVIFGLVDIRGNGSTCRSELYDFMRWQKVYVKWQDVDLIVLRILGVGKDPDTVVGGKEFKRLLKVVDTEGF